VLVNQSGPSQRLCVIRYDYVQEFQALAYPQNREVVALIVLFSRVIYDLDGCESVWM
jgi:hypothetical protein